MFRLLLFAQVRVTFNGCKITEAYSIRSCAGTIGENHYQLRFLCLKVFFTIVAERKSEDGTQTRSIFAGSQKKNENIM